MQIDNRKILGSILALVKDLLIHVFHTYSVICLWYYLIRTVDHMHHPTCKSPSHSSIQLTKASFNCCSSSLSATDNSSGSLFPYNVIVALVIVTALPCRTKTFLIIGSQNTIFVFKMPRRISLEKLYSLTSS